MAKPAARITDPISCPMPGHGPKAIASGSPDVFFDGLAAARKGDACTCGSALASAVSGTVFINGKNAALVDTVGTHGDIIIGGSGTVIIGDSHTPAPFIPPTPMVVHGDWIGFKIPANENYEGLSCVAHFEDGSKMEGVFDANNTVKFSNPTGKACTAIDYGTDEIQSGPSILETILGKIQR
ncbi:MULTISPECIES: PAAR domain-containing protein [unclassified Pseudomonas]|uniref:PAAR domain-containing protein n=1 Tax=unclassified Pseudomonas TaxID=196821 RepID=UPI002A361A7A|nr:MULTISPECIES: PAAR domain-containing protein [unclassified Pseudomonas]MDX9670041.1 PAAR domain-containing protein [Pseudomonas sp. P8_250]WPN35943.1 PAAR domain-containing protein [Pseudomonas sp. P8_139]WPN42254.1 PAAR domain-containing protein [Pseudomonas sp. P8_229]